jgi:hypothetical protein
MSKTTIYGSVSMTTIKATPIWKEVCDATGTVPKEIYNRTLKLALKFLGWDDEKGGYVKERDLHIRSSISTGLVHKTSVFRFPVSDTYEYKRIYSKLDILHVGDEMFTGWNDSHVKLSDFGNEEQPPTEGFNDMEESEA